MKETEKINLTNREMEILLKIIECESNLKIAKYLFLSPSTVRKHIENIYRKFDVHNKAQLIVKAVKYGIVEIE